MIENTVKNNFAFLILCMGEFEDSARISLNSMAKLASYSDTKIFVYADASGKKWLLENLEDKQILTFIEVDIKNVPLRVRNRFKSEQSFKYAKFGSDEMKSLTPLKWDALLEMFKSDYDLNAVVFSDLDVIWTRLPNFEVDELLKSDLLALLQDDTPKGSRGYFCTGIQIWKNSDRSINYISQLSLFHRKSHDDNFRYRNMLVGDEKAFNLWMAETKSLSFFARLDSRKYVIGHNVKMAILSLIFRRNPIAIHANYSSSEYLKFNKLNSFTEESSRWMSRLIILFRPKNR